MTRHEEARCVAEVRHAFKLDKGVELTLHVDMERDVDKPIFWLVDDLLGRTRAEIIPSELREKISRKWLRWLTKTTRSARVRYRFCNEAGESLLVVVCERQIAYDFAEYYGEW